jgi:hypothetical protein
MRKEQWAFEPRPGKHCFQSTAPGRPKRSRDAYPEPACAPSDR